MEGNAKKPKILIVDDDEKLLFILTHILEKEGFDVVATPQPLEGLRIAQESNISLIILDIVMPAMDGYELCRKLVEDDRTYSIPIIFLTGKTKPSDKILGYFCGASEYITKPFNNAELVATIRRLLRM